MIEEMAKNQCTETQKALSQLGVGAFFFACRSCEYLKVPQSEQRRTDIIRIRNIRFLLDGVVLSHSYPRLEFADCVSITFE